LVSRSSLDIVVVVAAVAVAVAVVAVDVVAMRTFRKKTRSNYY
jgi:hypothetical protein